jgi:protein-S-isoprenylcysteine O-methyltransferase Ste14
MSFLWNLWWFYVGGYVFAYPMRMWADKKRGEPFEDPELASQIRVIIPFMIWLVGGLIISVFVPISTGWTFYVGVVITLIGVTIVGFAFYSFAQGAGLVTGNFHQYSRNPNYIGWDLFMGGLTFIGWSDSLWRFGFLSYFIITVVFLHIAILVEEKFLLKKYGDSYREYLKTAPRYFQIKTTIQIIQSRKQSRTQM